MDYREFLYEHKLGEEFVEEGEVMALFFSEMEKGLSGEDSSLRMIPTYAKSPDTLIKNEDVIVMDAGGTNFRTCLLHFDDNGKPVITDFKKVAMPGVKKEVSAKEFYSIFADNIERFMGRSNRLGFCFSYAAEITKDHDGIPLMFSKEIKAPETLGRPLGKEILAVLSSRGYDVSKMKVSVVNDTVATLLAAKSECCIDASGYVGFILGTGTNTAYIENNSNIKKLKLEEGSQIINTESGCLRLELTDLDKLFMETTADPNSYHMEKKISGAYIGAFSFFVLKKAVEEGVFSPLFASSIKNLNELTTTDVGYFINSPSDKNTTLGKLNMSEEDNRALYMILKTIIIRASKLTALNLTCAVLKGVKKSSPEHPVVINADGTTFYKLPYLEAYTRYYLDKLLEKENHAFYKIINIDSSPIIGAAISALSI